ncbi:MAG: methyltransferase, partial [Planctomycetes bacterium]|nr:methyltransferase [Planctomycetota bacterium]
MTLRLAWRGATLRLEAPRSLFSTAYVDPGTRLLLETLPERGPASFLDLGCGYGALGLAVAARYPGGRGLLAD